MTSLSNIALTILGLIVTAVALIATLSQFRQSAEAAKKYRDQLAHAESIVKEQPEKAKPAWDLARVTLESYFNRNLNQIASIFWLSVVVMIAGFAIILWGITQAFRSPNALPSATIASAAGVITEFIGATFLFIYRSTVQQATSYSKTLERINSVGMAMQILDTMPDETKADDLKSRTKSRLVELLVQQTHELTEGRQASCEEKIVDKK